MRRTYGSGSPSIRDHAFTSDDSSRSSAAAQSEVSRNATRRSRVDRLTTKSLKPSAVTRGASPSKSVGEYYRLDPAKGCLAADAEEAGGHVRAQAAVVDGHLVGVQQGRVDDAEEAVAGRDVQAR